jgi:hypothetical protein
VALGAPRQMNERRGMRPVVISVTREDTADDLNSASVVIDATTSPWFEGTEEPDYFEIATAYCGDVEHSFRVTLNARHG